MKIKNFVPAVVLGLAGVSLAPGLSLAAVFADAGPDAASIADTVNNFRNALGNLNPNVAGSFGEGRREINWDAVPDRFADPNDLPPDFFNVNSPRGAVFETTGTSVRVSANDGVAPVRFDVLNPTYSSTFATFSPQKLFSAVGSNVVDVLFFVPGSNTPALTDGFGSVFTDVDLAGVTRIDYFGVNGSSLASEFVPASAGNQTLSFLGVTFNSPILARVRITNGNSVLGPNDDPGAGVDVVVMDDFIYGEPVQNRVGVPESSPVVPLLVIGGLLPLAVRLKRRESRFAPTKRDANR